MASLAQGLLFPRPTCLLPAEGQRESKSVWDSVGDALAIPQPRWRKIHKPVKQRNRNLRPIRGSLNLADARNAKC